ncbi:DUF6123 family protein [Alkalihalobacillus sp. AL-G]|uniref:DUF6123 family protein n=1 Tax=Alkalihalobacillus sp. AL-G TaxID=2926399 RepID=UPI00272B436D|nr:DUF6123 family protein [Alkalihalobacillus sp. AL-G]WLD91521.1 DUF6123 family protein [Alkalihalobacillus sp. AL-G]
MHVQSTGEYIQFLSSKGIHMTEEDIGFIYFGKKYTDSAEEVVNTAIETTLKVQVSFDGSYYVALLEAFKEAGVKDNHGAKRFVRNRIDSINIHTKHSIS